MALSRERLAYWQDRLRKANAEQKSITDTRPVFVALGPWAEELVEEWAKNRKAKGVKSDD